MIFTSYFAHIKKLAGEHPDLQYVSIAGKTPEWLDSSVIKVFKYSKLAPQWKWWREWHDKFQDNLEADESKAWYKEKYIETVLSKLNQKRVREELMEISKSMNVCLLCYETPEKFCHRHLVAEWLNNGEVPCTELT